MKVKLISEDCYAVLLFQKPYLTPSTKLSDALNLVSNYSNGLENSVKLTYPQHLRDAKQKDAVWHVCLNSVVLLIAFLMGKKIIMCVQILNI